MYVMIRGKRLLAAAIAAAICITGVVYLMSATSDVSAPGDDAVFLPIIMYHEIKTYKLGKDVITPWEFETDLKYLRDNNYHTVTMAEVIAYAYGDETLPENPIVLSFDDGYLNTYAYAFPLIKKYQMKIVFSIIGKNTDDFTRIPDNNIDYSHVTWDQLNEMLKSGLVEVQNHTYNMHSARGGRIGCMQLYGESDEDYERALTGDVGLLQDKILSLTGELPNTFAYPYGKSSKNTDAILKKLGFQASLSCTYGVNVIKREPEALFGLKRICRSHGDVLEKVLKKAMRTVG